MTITIKPHTPNNKNKNISLSRVKIRLVEEPELKRWNELVCKHHYLENANITGRQLRYVVEVGRRCVGLLSFSAPALALSGRDNWIGWDYDTRRKRVDFVIQNSRFLIFDWIRTPNLASKILSLARHTVGEDWLEKYDYKPLIIETFVGKQFYGTSYLADNWTRLGESAGYSRNSKGFYIQNDSPKTLWCIELQKDACKILSASSLPEEMQKFERVIKPTLTGTGVQANHLRSLFEALKSVPDPRGSKGKRHSIASCLSMIVCGMMAGCKSLEECATFGKSLKESQKASLRMFIAPGQYRVKRKVRTSPSHSAICDLLNKIDPLEFELAIRKWQQNIEGNIPCVISIDGKAIRATLEKNKMGKTDSGVHVVSAISHDDNSLFLPRPRLSLKDMSEKRH